MLEYVWSRSFVDRRDGEVSTTRREKRAGGDEMSVLYYSRVDVETETGGRVH